MMVKQRHSALFGSPSEATCLDIRLREQGWRVVPWGPEGLMATKGVRSMIVTDTRYNGLPWRHGSIARTDKMPTYADVAWLHQMAFPDGHAYQVFVPADEHINLHDRCLHLWGRLDGDRALPDFALGGQSI